MIFLQKFLAYAAFLAMLGSSPSALAAPEGERADQHVMNGLLETIINGDYAGFIGYGTPAFAELTEAQFSAVAAQVGPRLEQGYDISHLGMLRQQGLDISVWKITFNDQGDDVLATLNVRDGKVGGFFLR